jgi:hypothetical protein
VTAFDLAGRPDLFDGCAQSGTAVEQTFSFDPPVDGWYLFRVTGGDTTTWFGLLDDCGGAERTCADHVDYVRVELTAGTPALVVVQAYEPLPGAPLRELRVTGGLAAEDDCTDGLDGDADGRVDCVDADCSAEASCAGACGPDLAIGVPTALALGAESVFLGFSCEPDDGRTEATARFVAPVDGRFRFAGGPDSQVVVLDGCAGPELECPATTENVATVDLLAGQEVGVVLVDSVWGAGTLTVTQR